MGSKSTTGTSASEAMMRSRMPRANDSFHDSHGYTPLWQVSTSCQRGQQVHNSTYRSSFATSISRTSSPGAPTARRVDEVEATFEPNLEGHSQLAYEHGVQSHNASRRKRTDAARQGARARRSEREGRRAARTRPSALRTSRAVLPRAPAGERRPPSHPPSERIGPRGGPKAAGDETARSGWNVDMSRAPPAYKGGQQS